MVRQDAVIVGGGIIGLTHAHFLSRQGWSVCVLEQHPAARGASVRNFGMVWPVGQPLGEMREMALRSSELWREAAEEHGLWLNECGSLHLAYAADELAVLREYVDAADDDALELISPDEALRRQPLVKPEGLLGALWSPHEVCVDPRVTAAKLAESLAARPGVEVRFEAQAADIEPGRVVLASGEEVLGRAILVCPGAWATEHHSLMLNAGAESIRLQMMRGRIAGVSELGPHLCAGLTLLHYGAFQDCPSLARVRERMARERPEHIEHGIHILVSQHADFTFTIGDSHHVLPDAALRASRVDELMLEALAEFFPAERVELVERWEGVYARGLNEPYTVKTFEDGVWGIGALGGAGMTLSFGLAERTIAGLITPFLAEGR
jgi:FAD dependent oxidoreductase TIGR03364